MALLSLTLCVHVDSFSTGSPACFNDRPWHHNTKPQEDLSSLPIKVKAVLNPRDPDEIFVTLGEPDSQVMFKGFRVAPRIYDPENNGRAGVRRTYEYVSKLRQGVHFILFKYTACGHRLKEAWPPT